MIYILLTWLLAPIWWPIARLRQWWQPEPKRILIGEIAGIGDVVCSTAVFAATRMRYPNAHIALMVDVIAADLAPIIPAIDEAIVFKATDQRGIRGRFALMCQLSRFDTFICLIPSAAQLIASCWSALPRRYTVLPDVSVTSYGMLKPIMTHSYAHRSRTSFVATQLRLLAPLGITGDFKNRALHVFNATIQAAHAVIPDVGYRWVGLAIGSGQGLKALDPVMLQKLIGQLLTNPMLGIILIGGPKELALAESLCATAADPCRCVNTAGKVPLHLLPGVFSQMAVFVGVDSGVTYMADALGVPLVYIPGPASPEDQGPVRSTRIDLTVALECAPCSRVFVTPKTCRTGTHLCTRKFTSEDVAAAVYQLLGEAYLTHGLS